MKKIVRRITFQTVWLNVKKTKPSRSRKTLGLAMGPRLKPSNLDTKVNEEKSRQKQLCYVSEQDKPDQCVISEFWLFSFEFPSNTVNKFRGQPSRFECGSLESLSFERMICLKITLNYLNTMIARF